MIFWREIRTTRASIQVQLGHGLCAYGFRPSAAVSKVYNNICIISKFENRFQSFRNPTPICDEADFFNSYIIISYYTFDRITNTHVYRCTIYMFICNELCVCVCKNRNRSFTGLMYYIINYIFPAAKCYSNVFIKIKTIKQSFFFFLKKTQHLAIINEIHLWYTIIISLNPF